MKPKQPSFEIDSIYRCKGYNDFFIKIIEIDYEHEWIYGINAYVPHYYLVSYVRSSLDIPCGRWDIGFFVRAFIPVIKPTKIWADLNH